MGTPARWNWWPTVKAPGLVVLRGYQRRWLGGDVVAGVTVAAYLFPQVMAYASIAGLPPVTGLWGAVPALACYAVLGSSRLVSLGPESTTALMTAVAIGPLAAGDPVRYAKLATLLALLTGALAVVAWLARLGFVADLLSRPVVVGYLAGVALIMMAGQRAFERSGGVIDANADAQAFRRLAAFRRSELILALSACAGVLAFNILYGVATAIGLSVADLLARVGRPHDAVLGVVPGLAGMHDIDDYPQARTIPGLVIYRYDAPLFFANAQDFRRRALAAASQASPAARWFILNTEANVEVDFTALEAVEAVRAELTSQGTIVGLARVKQDLLDSLQAFGLAQKIGAQSPSSLGARPLAPGNDPVPRRS